MLTRSRVGTPARLALLMILLAGIPLASLGWLARHVLVQEEAIEHQQLRERLDKSAALLAHELDRALAHWDDLASAALTAMVSLPPDTSVLVFDADGVVRDQGPRLPYYPALRAAPEPHSEEIAAASVLEFRSGDLSKAEAAYRQIAVTSDRLTRAAALVGQARCLRKLHRMPDALDVYQQLAGLGDSHAAGFPAELLARLERRALFAAMGNEPASRREADLLQAAVLEGRFLIDRGAFDFLAESLSWTPPANETFVTAEAVAALWPQWQRYPSGRSVVTSLGQTRAAVWHRTEAGSVAIVGPFEGLAASLRPVAQDLHVSLSLENPDGDRVWGDATSPAVAVERSLGDAGLPAMFQVSPADMASIDAAWRSRRSVLAGAFALMALVIGAASYVVFRSVNRELRVARLQSDFVATVSHEFRTPLTAMRHLTEMLEEGRALPDQAVAYYHALGNETRRLHSMVEGLLDFGRLESGRRVYQLEDTDAVELVRGVVGAFAEPTLSTAHQLEVQAPSALVPIRADRETLTLALRNLLDNAVKYSPPRSTVTTSVEQRGSRVRICVEDHGAGIPAHEQRVVFGKFVRGSSAQQMNVKGTGIGLTMAARIVQAHHGRLELDSDTGRGSRFTIVLPTAGDQ